MRRLGLLAALAVLATGADAHAAAASKSCRPVHLLGELAGVEGHGVGCRFMRRWTVRFVRRESEPTRWSCVDAGDTGECRRRGGGAAFDWYLMD